MIDGGRDANSDGATYDFVGRLLYARLSQSFWRADPWGARYPG
jgi:hypothetical protein